MKHLGDWREQINQPSNSYVFILQKRNVTWLVNDVNNVLQGYFIAKKRKEEQEQEESFTKT